MNKEQLIEKINEWSVDMGESFYDYFCHTSIKDNSWAFFLLGKGYKEQANRIIQLILEGDTCIDLEILYDVYPEYDNEGKWIEGNYEKNIDIMAEFLVSSDYYREKVTKWFNDKSW